MSVIVELTPELEARVSARAAAKGVPVANYIQTMLEEVILPLPVMPAPVTLEEFDAIMDELAAGSEATPPPPIFTREDIYLDHD